MSNLIVRISNRPLRLTKLSRLCNLSIRPLSGTCIRLDEFRASEDLAKERYESRANESVETKRARLLYQSRKRGMLENGVILASFANKYLDKLNPSELDDYDRLINLPTNDWDIYYWATKTKPTPIEFETPIMTKLREHMNSKVSNVNHDRHNKNRIPSSIDDRLAMVQEIYEIRYKHRKNYWGKYGEDDIMLRPTKKHAKFEPEDMTTVSLDNFKDELFDYGSIKVGANKVPRQMEATREYLMKRLKRALPAPVSARHMREEKDVIVHSQTMIDNKDIISNEVPAQQLKLSKRETYMKHHEFMQYLLKSNFTDNPIDYDDEALAWAEMVWHRNYGSEDPQMRITDYLCKTCNHQLHCADPGLDGYLPKELLADIRYHHENEKGDHIGALKKQQCQKCRFTSKYGASLSLDLEPDQFHEFMKSLSQRKKCVAVILVDLTDFPSGLYRGLINMLGREFYQKIIIVGNKVDLLPYDGPGMMRRVHEVLTSNLSNLWPGSSNLHLNASIVVSAKTGFNLNSLVTKLAQFTEDHEDIFLLGTKNSGKSTLFNSLLQSDLSQIREGDLISRLAKYEIQLGNDHGVKQMLRFPIRKFDGWELVMKNRKQERFERDFIRFESSLMNSVRDRQKTMVHQSMLINHLDYPSLDFHKPKNNNLEATNHGVEQDQLLSPPIEHSNANHPLPNEAIKHQSLCTTPSDDINEANLPSEITVSEDSDDSLPNFADDHPLKKIVPHEPLSALDRIDVSEKPTGFFYHCPSVSSSEQIHDLLTPEEKLLVNPYNETLLPRKYSLRPLQTILIGGLARLDLLTSNEIVIFTIFASKYLPVHVIETRKADQFYQTFLGTPYLGVPIARLADGNMKSIGQHDEHENETRLSRWPGLKPSQEDFHVRSKIFYEAICDICLSSVGWAMINMRPEHECLIRAHTPDGRGIHARYPAMLPYAMAKLKQRKIRDTPLYDSKTYANKKMKFDEPKRRRWSNN